VQLIGLEVKRCRQRCRVNIEPNRRRRDGGGEAAVKGRSRASNHDVRTVVEQNLNVGSGRTVLVDEGGSRRCLNRVNLVIDAVRGSVCRSGGRESAVTRSSRREGAIGRKGADRVSVVGCSPVRRGQDGPNIGAVISCDHKCDRLTHLNIGGIDLVAGVACLSRFSANRNKAAVGAICDARSTAPATASTSYGDDQHGKQDKKIGFLQRLPFKTGIIPALRLLA